MSQKIPLHHQDHHLKCQEIITNKLKKLMQVDTLHVTKNSNYDDIQAQSSLYDPEHKQIIIRHLQALKIANALQQHQIPANLIFKSGSIFLESNQQDKIRALETKYHDQYKAYVRLMIIDIIAFLASLGILLSQASPILGAIGIAASLLSFYLNLSDCLRIKQECDDFSLSQYLRPVEEALIEVFPSTPIAFEQESNIYDISPSAPPLKLELEAMNSNSPLYGESIVPFIFWPSKPPEASHQNNPMPPNGR